MSISVSEKNWPESERDCPNNEGPPDLQEEFAKVLAKAVKELDLNWDAPDEPARSKLDSWYFQSSRRLAASRRKLSFFPDVHEKW